MTSVSISRSRARAYRRFSLRESTLFRLARIIHGPQGNERGLLHTNPQRKQAIHVPNARSFGPALWFGHSSANELATIMPCGARVPTLPESFHRNLMHYNLARMEEHLAETNGLALDGLKYRLGRKLMIDRAAEKVVGDDEANGSSP